MGISKEPFANKSICLEKKEKISPGLQIKYRLISTMELTITLKRLKPAGDYSAPTKKKKLNYQDCLNFFAKHSKILPYAYF